MPPNEVDVVPRTSNKNNLIGLHKAKRQKSKHPKSSSLAENNQDQMFVENKMKNALNRTIVEDERYQGKMMDLQLVYGEDAEK